MTESSNLHQILFVALFTVFDSTIRGLRDCASMTLRSSSRTHPQTPPSVAAVPYMYIVVSARAETSASMTASCVVEHHRYTRKYKQCAPANIPLKESYDLCKSRTVALLPAFGSTSRGLKECPSMIPRRSSRTPAHPTQKKLLPLFRYNDRRWKSCMFTMV